MLVFIDDSGDPGFKLDKGSTSHFVIAMVIFNDELEAEKTSLAIKELKRKTFFSTDVEFRFFRTSRRNRLNFFNEISRFNFKIRCLVVEKAKIHSHELRNNKNSFYSYFIKEALKNNDNTIENAKVRIDGSGDRDFKRNFFAYLRRELNSDERKIIRNCKMVDSKSNSLIQMADMIAGCVNRSYSFNKIDRGEYKNIVKKHIEDEWCFR